MLDSSSVAKLADNEVGMTDTIVVVEDEPDLASSLEYNLQRSGYDMRVANTGEQGLAVAMQVPPPDLILLDIMLPDISGVELARRFLENEQTRHIPVVIVSARGEEIDRVIGFELGAADYVVKPFSMKELLLRIRAILRARGVDGSATDGERLQVGCLAVDIGGRRVWVNGHEVGLTGLQFNLLELLLRRRERVQSRETLLQCVWGQSDTQLRAVDTEIARLRSNLGPAGQYINTIRGVGYCLRLHPESDA